MFGNLGAGEIILIVLVILLLFGAKKIPELAQGLGKGMKEFKKSLKDVEEEIKKMLRQLVTGDEYVNWFAPNDIHFIVTVKNDSSNSSLGLIHYVISPKIAENEAKICTLGVAPPM